MTRCTHAVVQPLDDVSAFEQDAHDPVRLKLSQDESKLFKGTLVRGADQRIGLNESVGG